jgi:hypothetical protein
LPFLFFSQIAEIGEKKGGPDLFFSDVILTDIITSQNKLYYEVCPSPESQHNQLTIEDDEFFICNKCRGSFEKPHFIFHFLLNFLI